MSTKVKQALIKCFNNIENKTFDEDTIRTLLFVLREHINHDSLIKELAHFIAHTERDKGVFHKKINSRYTKLKLVEEQAAKNDISDLRKKIKTEDELSDFMLGGVSVDKIEAKLFNILYSDGLDDLPESHLLKYTGFNKVDVKGLLEQYYIRKDGYYYLTTNTTQNLINAFKTLPNSKYNPNEEAELAGQIHHANETVKKIRSTLDRIQKVIRGAIFFNSVFETKTFHKEIEKDISKIMDKFGIDKKYLDHIKTNGDDILLCIMTLLHDCKFTFFDKAEARIFLCFYLQYNFEEAQKPNYNYDKLLYDNGVLALYISEKKITFPLFVSELLIKNYLPYADYISKPLSPNITEIVWTTATRIDKHLQLTNDSDNEVNN